MARPCQHPTLRACGPVPGVHADVSAGSPHAGQLLAGRYRLTELVARGATGRVWRAYDEVLARQVAVKQLAHEHSWGLAEARIAARVRHPNVAAVHDAFEHDRFGWLVMDYHGDGTLDDLLGRRRRLPPPVVAALGLQLLAALTAVHDAGVVHCDVKPANLLLGADGRLVLADFGIAETDDSATPRPGERRHRRLSRVHRARVGPRRDTTSACGPLVARGDAVRGRRGSPSVRRRRRRVDPRRCAPRGAGTDTIRRSPRAAPVRAPGEGTRRPAGP